MNTGAESSWPSQGQGYLVVTEQDYLKGGPIRRVLRALFMPTFVADHKHSVKERSE